MAKTVYKEKSADIHALNVSELKQRIKSGNVGGAYVFYGDEEYTKNHYYRLICDASGDKMLNVKTIYSGEFTLADFMCACSTSAVESADMFATDENESASHGGRVVRLISPDLSVLTKKDETFFLETLADLPKDCAVIFWLDSEQSELVGKGIYKKICETALAVNFKREPVGSSVLITWILRHFSKAKLNVDRSTAVYLCSVVGNDMTTLKNEIDKCIDYLRIEERDELTKNDVDFICIKSTDAQIFDVSSGALSGSFLKAAKALKVLRDKKEKPLLVFGTISKSVNDLCITESGLKQGLTYFEIAKKAGLYDFSVKRSMQILDERGESFAKAASSLCLEYDEKLKSSKTDEYELLTELIFKLSCYGKNAV